MPSAVDRIDFAPPRDAGAIRSFGLALLIHAALIAALTWGVNWKRSDSAATFDAELWTNAPAEAVPMSVPVITPPALQTPAEPTTDVDIALEQEKKRKKVKELKDQRAAQAKIESDKVQQLKDEQLKADKLAKTDQAKADALKAKQSQLSAEKQRDENLKRITEMVGNSGGNASGTSSRATDRKSTRLNSSHRNTSRMPSSA